jgi:hypothetical protein
MEALLLGALFIVPLAIVATLLVRGNVRIGRSPNGSIYSSCISCGTLVGDNQVGRSTSNIVGSPIFIPGEGGGQCPNCGRRN